MTDWSEILDRMTASAEGGFRVTVTDDWLQGRTLYGGLVAALGLRAMERAIPDLPPVRSVETVFLSPLPAGEVSIRVALLRRGRHVAFVEAVVAGAAGTSTRLLAVFGAARPSAIRVPPAPRTPGRPRDAAFPIPFLEGITPAFTRHFECRLSEGGFPFSGSDDAATGGYLRYLRDPGCDAAALLGLLDAFPAPILPVATAPFMASTVRWSVHFVAPPSPPADGYWWFRADAVAASEGYAVSVGTLQSNGEVVAWAEQLVAVFDQPSG